MRTRFFLSAICAAALLAAGCQENPVTPEDDSITITKGDSFSASWEGEIFDVSVQSNCSWNISKTDPEGNAVDWVKCDRATGNGDVAFRVRVYKNNTVDERRATVTLSSGKANAFIDVTQAGNPNPDQPLPPGPDPIDPTTDPDGNVITLSFDFSEDPFDGWPTAAGYEHTEGGITCVYSLSGKDYPFILADCGGASAAQMFWAPASNGIGNRLAFGAQYRYLGLPAIEGYRLGEVSCTSALLNAKSASISPKIAVTNKIAASANDAKAITDESPDIVPGGTFQVWQPGGGETYIYKLSETNLNTVYFLYALVRGAVSTLELTYYKDGYTPEPGPDNPDNPDNPQPGDDVVISFDFTVTPFDGWPTAGGYEHTEGGISCVYSIGSTDYTFVLADCGGASKAQMFWAPASGDLGNRLAFGAQYRYLGLPVIDGYRLSKVSCVSVLLNAASASLSPKIAITDRIAPSADAAKALTNESPDIVSGGQFQVWEPQGGSYTYKLTGTEPGKLYYMYALVKGAVSSLELTYVK